MRAARPTNLGSWYLTVLNPSALRIQAAQRGLTEENAVVTAQPHWASQLDSQYQAGPQAPSSWAGNHQLACERMATNTTLLLVIKPLGTSAVCQLWSGPAHASRPGGRARPASRPRTQRRGHCWLWTQRDQRAGRERTQGLGKLLGPPQWAQTLKRPINGIHHD